jgi:5-methylcytosine-specific restriction endonuclease McrA
MSSPYRRDPNTEVFLAALRADPCAYCTNAGGTVDHVDPLGATRGAERRARKGWENLTAACEPCNGRKGDRSLLSFLSALHQ